MTRQIARPRAAAITALLAVAALLVGGWATPAEATSYRFWAYWLGTDDGWSFSSQGASRVPTDGTVDGWRFAVSEASSSTIRPGHSSSFRRICGSTDAVDGSKRVGLVVDFGTTSDAPNGETPKALISTCVVAPTDANGYEVLDLAGLQLRTDSGLICGLNGYPATECGVVVADPAPSPSDDASGNNGGGSGPGPDTNNSGSDPASSGGNGEPSGSGTSSGNAGNNEPSGNNRRSDAKQKNDGSDSKSQPAAIDPNPDPTAVAVSPAAAAVSTSGSGSPAGLAIGLAIVAALLAVAYVLRRRRA